MLDATIGSERIKICSIALLNLFHKLDLKNAEAKLMKRIVEKTNAAKVATDLIEIYEKI